MCTACHAYTGENTADDIMNSLDGSANGTCKDLVDVMPMPSCVLAHDYWLACKQ